MSDDALLEAGPHGDREIRIVRLFDAPPALIWRAVSDSKHLGKWWGPTGFTTTTHEFDFRVGGVWRHTMHGPDGTDYPNYSVYREIEPNERIVYSLGRSKADAEDGAVAFLATWTLDPAGPGRTKLTLNMVFATAEARDASIRQVGAVEGGKQTLGRLAQYLPALN